jgi:hypothetical protein
VALSFIGNNQFAYASSCYHYGPEIFGVQRASDGTLSYLNINPPSPAEKSRGFYCPWAAAADPTNHPLGSLFAGVPGGLGADVTITGMRAPAGK